MSPSATPPFPEGALRAAEEKVAIALTTGAEATGKGFHDFKSLELQFASSLGFLIGSLLDDVIDANDAIECAEVWVGDEERCDGAGCRLMCASGTCMGVANGGGGDAAAIAVRWRIWPASVL